MTATTRSQPIPLIVMVHHDVAIANRSGRAIQAVVYPTPMLGPEPLTSEADAQIEPESLVTEPIIH